MEILLVLLLLAAFVWLYAKAVSEAEKGKEARKEEWIKKLQEEKLKEVEQRKQTYELEKQKQIARLGEADKTFMIEEYDINKEIAIFGQTEKIVLLGNEYSFSEVLSCAVDDDYKVVKGKTEYTSTTSSSNGSTIGRAIVGGVLAGGAGAIIGGSTAKKETTTMVNQEDDTIMHNYTIIVNVDSLANPIVTISVGNDKAKLNEIVGVLNVIIRKNESRR